MHKQQLYSSSPNYIYLNNSDSFLGKEYSFGISNYMNHMNPMNNGLLQNNKNTNMNTNTNTNTNNSNNNNI